ncbi:unnamed protein product [Leptosia nina]|uniref:Uncharacterized protein n=1 Tax=Leptosia nina TaxID=320188 RepID=A0AAV1JB61_9NEOP
MDQLVMKTEIHPNGDILLYYVDENQELGETSGILENEQQEDIQMLSETKYVIEDTGESESADELDLAQASEQLATEPWTDDEIRRLIVFYLDNKETFQSGTTKKKHLWAVACKTMLLGKQPLSCEYKLRVFRDKYFEIHAERLKGNNTQWPFYNLCHQTFQNDNPVDSYLNINCTTEIAPENIKKENVPVVKKNVGDANVEKMLNLYIQYKNIYMGNVNSKAIWDRIARDMKENDVDYWYKRFLNFKQHYIRMLHKRVFSGEDSINWPYMKHFDKIFKENQEFQRKYAPAVNNTEIQSWNDTDRTFLAKYYYDCLHEFQDPTIPNIYLWREVGRLLDKKPDNCEEKFMEMKNKHFDTLSQGNYDLNERIPLQIILDYIISKEVILELEKSSKYEHLEDWNTELLDVFVQFIYDNINMVKDSVCFYICLAIVAKKLNIRVSLCLKQWNNLVAVYKSIMYDKKENPEIEVDWRYIDMFDTIFDYGMDTKLLEGYEKEREQVEQISEKVGVKKINIKDLEDNEYNSDVATYNEKGYTTREKRKIGEEKAVKILEYYLKNKDKFNSPNYKKLTLWASLANQIRITPTECAHRFRNLKQVYVSYVQKEMNKPEMPIIWPYYALCKKVFGYRAIKSKLRNSKADSSDAEDWSPREIKKLINYAVASKIILEVEIKEKWKEIAEELGRSEVSCCDKFLELRKSYRKLKTMKTNNPDTKVSWKYFNMLDDIYSSTVAKEESMDVDSIKTEVLEADEDYECIIVIPEGQDINNAQIIYKTELESNLNTDTKTKIIWDRKSKSHLLKLCLKYFKEHSNKDIDFNEMWIYISVEMNKPAKSCRRMYLILKKRYLSANDKKYENLMKKILTLRRTLGHSPKDGEERVQDVEMSREKVEKALNYYLQNIEDFTNPNIEKQYIWTELATSISEPVDKVYRKFNFLKQEYASNKETDFQDIIKEIILRENSIGDNFDPTSDNCIWSDIEVERLLTWYLAHLDKFKNSKFVQSFLWMEASDILKKSPLECSKKMLEIRAQYRTMLKENPDELKQWRSNSSYQEMEFKGETSLSLRDILPVKAKYYDKNRAPKLLGEPTIVYFHVTVLSLDSINEESMVNTLYYNSSTYVADIFLAQSWRDPRLRLPENMHEEYRILDVEWLNKIWRPDCFFKNAKKVTFHEMSIPNHYLWLYHDKTLLYMAKLTLVLSCAMKFESYPHDTQSCSMMIESLSHTVHDLVFIWNLTDPLVVNPDIELPQLDISNNYTSDCTIEYSTGNFTCLAVVFNLRRRLGYHLFHTYIPSALIVVMSWISFWIKPEAIPARVTLGVTSLLTLATQNTQSQQSLPPVSYVKAIDVWMSSCSVFVFLSLFEFAVVNNYMGPVATKAMKGYSDEDLSRDLDAFKHIFPNSVDPRASTSASLPQYDTFCNGRETAVYIDRFSRFFFPFSFFILNVVYWSTFL